MTKVGHIRMDILFPDYGAKRGRSRAATDLRHCKSLCGSHTLLKSCLNTFPRNVWIRMTSTTRTAAFWDTPAAPWLPILVIHFSSRSQVKTRQGQSYKLKKNATSLCFENLQTNLCATHFLKLLAKMYKYEIDPTKTVGATERTKDAGWTDGRADSRTEWSQFTPPTASLCGGITRAWPVM